MRLTNDCYLVTLRTASGAERYYRDGQTWVKQSLRGRRFEATAEQVLNHLLPALAGIKPGVAVEVRHRDLDSAASDLLDGLRSDRA